MESQPPNVHESSTPEKESLQEAQWRQLLQFSEASTALLDSLQYSDLDEEESVLASLPLDHMSRRQQGQFIEKAKFVYQRARFNRSELKTAQETLGTDWQKKLFAKWLNTDPNGEIEIVPDNLSLIFICKDGQDYLRIQGNSPFTGRREAETSGMYLGNVIARQDNGQLAATDAIVLDGSSLNDPVTRSEDAANLRSDTNQFITQTESTLAEVLAHEKQHVVNHLFIRPGHKNKGEFFTALRSDVTMVLENAHQRFTNGNEGLAITQNATEGEQLLFEQQLEVALKELDEALVTLVKQFDTYTLEFVVKEEILAYWLTNTSPSSIKELMPAYISKSMHRVYSILICFRELLDQVADSEVLESLGIVSLSSLRAAEQPSVEDATQRITDLYSDKVSQRFAWVNARFQSFIQAAEVPIEQGIDSLTRLEEVTNDRRHPFPTHMMPLLITQPLHRWKRIIDRFIKDNQQTSSQGTMAA